MKNLILLLCVFASFFCFPKDKKFNKSDGVLINGYDPVSYFVNGKPQQGSSEFSINYQGVKIHFSSAVNKKKFLRNPKSYLPQYGGYCAYAMAKNGSIVSINPKAFKISNGKLFLFYKNVFSNTLKKWNQGSEPQQVRSANAHWKSYQ